VYSDNSKLIYHNVYRIFLPKCETKLNCRFNVELSKIKLAELWNLNLSDLAFKLYLLSLSSDGILMFDDIKDNLSNKLNKIKFDKAINELIECKLIVSNYKLDCIKLV